MITPRVRTGLTHAGTALGGAVAAVGVLSQNSVDLYALWNQLNEVVAAVGKLIAMATPIATTAYGVYKAGTAQKLVDIVADPAAPQIAREMPATPQAVAVGNALKAP